MATNFKSKANTNGSGFALLMTLIVVTVVISIGLTVLDLSIKQVRLSTNSRDSETSFHAANAGVECARYIRRTESANMEVGNNITPACFGGTLSTDTHSQITTSISGDGQAFKYIYDFSWGSVGEPRCTEVITLVASATPIVGASLGSGLIVSNMTSHIAGYSSPTNSWSCAAGERCTVLSVKGYNRSCSPTYGYGTIEREVLLQF